MPLSFFGNPFVLMAVVGVSIGFAVYEYVKSKKEEEERSRYRARNAYKKSTCFTPDTYKDSDSFTSESDGHTRKRVQSRRSSNVYKPPHSVTSRESSESDGSIQKYPQSRKSSNAKKCVYEHAKSDATEKSIPLKRQDNRTPSETSSSYSNASNMSLNLAQNSASYAPDVTFKNSKQQELAGCTPKCSLKSNRSASDLSISSNNSINDDVEFRSSSFDKSLMPAKKDEFPGAVKCEEKLHVSDSDMIKTPTTEQSKMPIEESTRIHDQNSDIQESKLLNTDNSVQFCTSKHLLKSNRSASDLSISSSNSVNDNVEFRSSSCDESLMPSNKDAFPAAIKCEEKLPVLDSNMIKTPITEQSKMPIEESTLIHDMNSDNQESKLLNTDNSNSLYSTELEILSEKNDLQPKEAICKACDEEAVITIAEPCGHYYLCSDCACRVYKIYKKCYTCHEEMTSFKSTDT